MKLQTERLILREYVEADWEAVHVYGSDPEVVKHQVWGPNTEDETKGFIAFALKLREQEPRTNYQLAVTLKETGQLIGGCGLTLSEKIGEIGYTLNPAYWGQGYATEVAQALLAFGFGDLNLHRITATCDPANIGSSRVLEKAGMTREGHLRENMWGRGTWRDSYLYAILEHEFVRDVSGQTQ